MHKRAHLTLTYKIMVTMVISVSVIIVSLSIFTDIKTREMYNQNLTSIYNQTTQQYVSNLQYKYNNYHSILVNMATVSRLNSMFSLDFDKNHAEVLTVAQDVSRDIGIMLYRDNPNGEFMDMLVFSYKKDFPIYNQNITSIEGSYYPHTFPRPELLANTPYFMYTNASKQKILVLTTPVYQEQKGHTEIIAVITLQINANKFFDFSEGTYKKYADNIEISISDDNYMLWESVAGVPSVSESVRTIVTTDNSIFNWTVTADFAVLPNSQRGSFQISLLLLSGTLMLLTIAVSIILSNKVTANLNLLISRISQVEKGYFSTSEPISGGDEISIIHANFNKMVETLDRYINENYVLKIAQREAELDVLQSQINPHFLYNTLETIDSMAAVEGHLEISEVCNKLGQIFRYNITKTNREYATVAQEINHVENYISIQKMRFGDRLNVKFDIDESTLDMPILKFILQPIVENSILHALEDKSEGGRLQISVKKIDDCLHITVSDNGIGFKRDVLEEINAIISSPDTTINSTMITGIGLTNVINRIKIVYSNQAKILITSQPNFGTQIEFVLNKISPPK